MLHWIHCDQNCLVTLTAFMEKRKKYRKESQLNDLEQFIWHFIVTSGTWTINMPVYRLSPFVGWTYLPYAASPDLWKKKKLPWPSRQDALLQWLNQFWLLSFFSYHSQSWLQFLGYNVKSVRLERLAIK